ncbi:MAG: hypothetical protein AAF554_14305 [Bacteroidota bacterium]
MRKTSVISRNSWLAAMPIRNSPTRREVHLMFTMFGFDKDKVNA